MSKLTIFGTEAELKTELVKFRGGSIVVTEFMDEQYFEEVTLPMRAMEVPDPDEPVKVAKYNRAFNRRIIALSLTPALNTSMDMILEELKTLPMKAMEKLLAAALRVNGLAEVKNSRTTTSG